MVDVVDDVVEDCAPEGFVLLGDCFVEPEVILDLGAGLVVGVGVDELREDLHAVLVVVVGEFGEDGVGDEVGDVGVTFEDGVLVLHDAG